MYNAILLFFIYKKIMEDIINPHWSDINERKFVFFYYDTFLAMTGIWFIEGEEYGFDIQKKIEMLDAIIANIINRLKDDTYENKNYIINQLKEKQKLLKELLSQFEEIKHTYLENDNYYRNKVFEFYKAKYYETPLLSFFQRNHYISIMNEIQVLLYKKFKELCQDYVKIRDDFFEINEYVIRINKFFKMNMLLELKNFLTFMKKKILNKLILIVRFIFNVLILKN